MSCRLFILHRFLAPGAIDQGMDRAGICCPAGAQNLRRLAGKGCKKDFTIYMFGKVLCKRRLARSGVTEQPKNRRPAFLQPARNSLQGFILLWR